MNLLPLGATPNLKIFFSLLKFPIHNNADMMTTNLWREHDNSLTQYRITKH